MELLTVISIVTLLAGLLLPALLRAKAKAGQVGCISNQRQLTLGNALYLAEQDQRFPFAILRLGTAAQPIISFDDLLYRHIGGPALTRAEVNAGRIPSSKQLKLLICPADKAPPEPTLNTPGTWRRSYSMPEANMSGVALGNGSLSMAATGGVGVYYSTTWGPTPLGGREPALSEGRIEEPSDTLTFVERISSANLAGNDDYAITKFTGNQKYGMNFDFKAHHARRMVYSYCDQHVEARFPENTWGPHGDDFLQTGQWTIRAGD